MLNLDNFVIILDQTTHSGNLGSVARIVKNMGIKQVRLVNPHSDPLDEQAIAMSANATDTLASFQIYNSLEQATADTTIILATSARKRAFSPIVIQPDQILNSCIYNALSSVSDIKQRVNDPNQLNLLANHISDQKIAILFGTENSGLTNEALQMSNYHIVIDCNPDYTSLNLSMAVLVIAYELRKQTVELNSQTSAHNLITFLTHVLEYNRNNSVERQINTIDQQATTDDTLLQSDKNKLEIEALATHQQIEFFLDRLENHLIQIGFTQHPGTMQRLRLLTYRCQLNTKELAVLQGIITAQTQLIKKLEQKSLN